MVCPTLCCQPLSPPSTAERLLAEQSAGMALDSSFFPPPPSATQSRHPEPRAEVNIIPAPYDAAPGTARTQAWGVTPRVPGPYLGGCTALRADSARDISRARCRASSSL